MSEMGDRLRAVAEGLRQGDSLGGIDLLAAVMTAERVAADRHAAGTCHLSAYSCSYCEADR